ncbi:unnamed protein product, partial [Mesorhabditis spiculigera]
MSSDEDDFMSDKFLQTEVEPQCKALLPKLYFPFLALSKSHHEKRMMRIEKNRFDAEDEQRKVKKPKIEVEVERRNEALQKPIEEDSVGFKLMAKMGFKSGMSLGKKKDENDLGSGIKEPVPLEVKIGRKGLGHETAEVEKSRKRIDAIMERMAARSKMTDELSDDFRERRRIESICRLLMRAIIKARKTCAQLDIAKGRDTPIVEWFWPSYKSGDDAPEDKPTFSKDQAIRSKYTGFFYANGVPSPIHDGKSSENTPGELLTRIKSLVEYLKEEYVFCAICQKGFMEVEEMNVVCPGREEHEATITKTFRVCGINALAEVYDRIRAECEKRDLRRGLDEPTVPWHWKARFNAEAMLQLRRAEFEAETERFVYTNGKAAPPEIRFNELPLSDLKEKLAELLGYLREEHFYCLGCGTQSDTFEEMELACAGDHELDDYADH